MFGKQASIKIEFFPETKNLVAVVGNRTNQIKPVETNNIEEEALILAKSIGGDSLEVIPVQDKHKFSYRPVTLKSAVYSQHEVPIEVTTFHVPDNGITLDRFIQYLKWQECDGGYDEESKVIYAWFYDFAFETYSDKHLIIYATSGFISQISLGAFADEISLVSNEPLRFPLH